MVGLTLRVWEKLSNGPVAESVYVTDAIKNIYKSGVFRLRDEGGGFRQKMEVLGGNGSWSVSNQLSTPYHLPPGSQTILSFMEQK